MEKGLCVASKLNTLSVVVSTTVYNKKCENHVKW